MKRKKKNQTEIVEVKMYCHDCRRLYSEYIPKEYAPKQTSEPQSGLCNCCLPVHLDLANRGNQ